MSADERGSSVVDSKVSEHQLSAKRRKMPHWRRHWAPIFVLLIGISATLFLTRLASLTTRNGTEREFNELVERTFTSFTNTVDREIQVARATAGMLSTPGEVDARSFQRFVEHVDPGKGSRRAIGWSSRVELGDGGGDHEIFPVFHVEPRSASSLMRRGFDLGSMPELRAALGRAGVTERAAIAVPLARQDDWDAVVFFPIHAPDPPSRIERSRGFAFVAFSMTELLTGALANDARLVHVQVKDPTGSPDAPVVWRVASERSKEPMLRAVRSLDVGGRSWQLEFTSTPAFESAHRRALSYLLMFAGFFVSLVLTAVTWAETRARARAEEVSEKLANSDEELRRASQAKDEFLAMLGHELRNPLGAIANAIKVMRLRELTDPVMGRALDIADRQVRHQTRLVDDLLDLTRLGAGKIRLDLANLDLNDVARRAAAASRDAVEDHGHTFELQTALTPVVVKADATRLEQIIYNLLSNSVKYTPSGGRIRLTVERDEAQGEAVLCVRDDGVGIEPAAIESVFNPFFQGSRNEVRSESAGLGIGLSIVQRLVQGHGGRVAARSEGRGRGTEFIVRLPLSPEPFLLAPAPAEEETSKHAARDESLCVLVVEDSADNREMLRELLNLLGHRVHEADCGAQGIERALLVEPDLVLIDIGLPDLDGLEVARRIRASRASSSRLVALTGFGSPEDRRRSLDAGFDDHLVKPLKLQKLLDLLNDIHPATQRRITLQPQAQA